MKRLFLFLFLITVMYSFSSCQNDTEEIFPSEAFAQKNSYLEFKDSESFFDVFNSVITDNYSIPSSLSGNFNSLENKYKSLKEQSETKSNGELDDIQIIENQVGSITLTELLNEDGVIKIGESIYKFDGNYAYIINDGNENTLQRLLDGEELSSLENVSYKQVILPLVKEENINTKSSTGGEYERSPVFTTTNDSKRREHVKFNPYLLVINNAQTEIVIEMEGRAQKKKILGIWGGTFSDEMVWGEIHVNSGSWNYNQPPVGGLPIPQGTNYFVTGLRAGSRNNTMCRWMEKLGNTGGVSGVKVNITFKTKKSDNQPANWTGVYTNNYTSITK